jgi:hypothetical protein
MALPNNSLINYSYNKSDFLNPKYPEMDDFNNLNEKNSRQNSWANQEMERIMQHQ